MKTVLALLLVVVFLIVGCSQSLYNQGRRLTEEGDYDQAIDALYQEINKNPQSADAWRELGVAFYEKGDLIKAEDALKQANNIKPDARSNLYLGLIYEKQEMTDQAITAYGAALSLEGSGKTKNVIRAHLDHLIGNAITKEVNTVLANEASIDIDTIPDNTVAVVGFDDSHLPPDLAPLALGLAEFTSADLAKVKSIRVVDRMKIDVILDELKLSSSQYVNPATAPRLGRLLGSRNMVTGSMLGIGDKDVRIDGVVVNTVDSAVDRTQPSEAEVDKIFQAQKQLVFDVIDTLGIKLTPEERDAISAVPTESYLAFLAYCKGLDYEQRGYLRDAEASYQQAEKLDPGFTQAQNRAEVVSGSLAMGDGGQYSVAQFETTVMRESEPGDIGLGLDSRLNLLSLNGGIIPGYIPAKPVPIRPPVVNGVGTVTIKGDLNAQ
ncbi:MAG: tetratricopeptide repeat protein [Candidatus Zixiibacteriota bacterium]|jgi:tetratricopeptide (TPR) repeat protein